ncbi:hypothetical protein [Paracoccus sanguinis]|uniref:Uncharacterized protein n=1 Tax=Paracoccus sanguinis TaxID=1545044 RepID=A0A099GIW0_9RHOB|nr:hypothetical protein [Paracoccus sanguinis]KGJ22063.1 hypothetical protein IX56_10365 [Paracoccus sanguinis]
MSRLPALRLAARRLAAPCFAGLAALALGGCMEGAQSQRSVPSISIDGAQSQRSVPSISIDGAPVASVRDTGLPASALVSLGAVDDKVTVFFRQSAVTPAQLKAAPARICAGKGVRSSQVRDPEHPRTLPGVKILVVRCAA